MNSVISKVILVGALAVLILLPAGCVLAPRGWRTEEKKFERAGEQYKRPSRPGEQVVTSGQFLLGSESRVREAIQKHLSEKLLAQPNRPQHTH